MKKANMPTMSKALDMSSATVEVVPDLIKALADEVVPDLIKALSDATVRSPAVNGEDLQPYWKSEKRPHFSRWSAILFFSSFSNTFLTTERKLTGR